MSPGVDRGATFDTSRWKGHANTGGTRPCSVDGDSCRISPAAHKAPTSCFCTILMSLTKRHAQIWHSKFQRHDTFLFSVVSLTFLRQWKVLSFDVRTRAAAKCSRIEITTLDKADKRWWSSYKKSSLIRGDWVRSFFLHPECGITQVFIISHLADHDSFPAELLQINQYHVSTHHIKTLGHCEGTSFWPTLSCVLSWGSLWSCIDKEHHLILPNVI